MNSISQNYKIVSLSLIFVLLFSMFSFGNNFDASAQEISLTTNSENKINQSFSVFLANLFSVIDQKKKTNELSSSHMGKSLSISIYESISISDDPNSKNFDQIIFVKQNMDRKAILEKIFYEPRIRS